MDDLINRQDAIDALKQHYWDSELQKAKDDPCVIDAMTDLDIRIIKALPSSQTEQRWIPCSERLPEEWRDVLLSFDKSITEWTNVGYMFRDEETFEYWFQSDGMSYKKDDVLAWMPLPDAYEEDK